MPYSLYDGRHSRTPDRLDESCFLLHNLSKYSNGHQICIYRLGILNDTKESQTKQFPLKLHYYYYDYDCLHLIKSTFGIVHSAYFSFSCCYIKRPELSFIIHITLCCLLH